MKFSCEATSSAISYFRGFLVFLFFLFIVAWVLFCWLLEGSLEQVNPFLLASSWRLERQRQSAERYINIYLSSRFLDLKRWTPQRKTQIIVLFKSESSASGGTEV